MPKQNQPKYTNKSVSHHNIGFNIKRPIAIELDKEIEKIREKSATRGHVLEEVIAFYIKNKSI